MVGFFLHHRLVFIARPQVGAIIVQCPSINLWLLGICNYLLFGNAAFRP